MKLLAALVLGLSLGLAHACAAHAGGEPGKKEEVRKPKSASINCKDAANADKIECKKASKEMPKIEKPVVEKKPEPAKKQ
jgi:hypothetical protein